MKIAYLVVNVKNFEELYTRELSEKVDVKTKTRFGSHRCSACLYKVIKKLTI